LSDVDKSVGAAYGAKKGDDEQWNDFAKRVTVLIDPEGVVRRTYTVSDVTTHPDTVLADIRSSAG
jgi:peroxiredoxin